tara:strand:+ start:1217 stop:1672 length:456 start_codon:yes stop_codon:yes gene_type:complete
MSDNGIISAIENKTENGNPNYSIELIDGRRCYLRGVILNPMPLAGDAINFDVINTKTSAKGNQYTNIQNLVVLPNPTNQAIPPQAPQQMPQNNYAPKPPSSALNKNETQRLDIFVTGVVGRSMGSGHFSVNDIEELTKNAVRAFNENLKEL